MRRFVFWAFLILIIITVGISGCIQTPEGTSGGTDKICKDMCGDGICQEVVCQAIGCPCAETPETCPEDCTSATELPNPAAVYCEKNGGVFQPVETPHGTTGYCSLPDGRVCEEWAFFNSNGTECIPLEQT